MIPECANECVSCVFLLLGSFPYVCLIPLQCDRFCLYLILICYILLFKKNKNIKYTTLMMALRGEWCRLHIEIKSLGKGVSCPRLMESDESGFKSNKRSLEAHTGHRSWEIPLQGPSKAMNGKIQLFRTGINHFPLPSSLLPGPVFPRYFSKRTVNLGRSQRRHVLYLASLYDYNLSLYHAVVCIYKFLSSEFPRTIIGDAHYTYIYTCV